MLIAICIFSAALIAISLAVVFIRSRRTAAGNPSSDSARRRALMHDCGDDVVWKAGKLGPIIVPKEEEQLSKRAFFKRVAFSVSGLLVAWLVSRSENVAFGAETGAGNRSLKNGGQSKGKELDLNNPFHEDISHNDQAHQDQAHQDQPHQDNDFGGGNHQDNDHGDNAHGDIHVDD